jgi:hypothetical protein
MVSTNHQQQQPETPTVLEEFKISIDVEAI